MKKIYGIQKTVHAGCAKGFCRKLFCIICLLIFYAAYFIIFMSYFHFVLESILNQSCLLLQLFYPSRQKQHILVGACTRVKFSVRHKILSKCNGILLVFYLYFKIFSTINKEIIIIIMILTINDNKLSCRFIYPK